MAMQHGPYKIRSYSNGQSKKTGTQYTNYSITVPSPIAEALPDGITFGVTMTKEGLLYKPVKESDPPQVELPDWAKETESNGKETNGDN